MSQQEIVKYLRRKAGEKFSAKKLSRELSLHYHNIHKSLSQLRRDIDNCIEDDLKYDFEVSNKRVERVY